MYVLKKVISLFCCFRVGYIAVILLLGSQIAIASDYQNIKLTNSILYKTMQIHQGVWQPSLQALANIKAYDQQNILLPFSIKLKNVFVNKGDQVNKNQVMISFDSAQLISLLTDYAAALKQLALAHQQLNYYHKILDKKLIQHRDIFTSEQYINTSKKLQIETWSKLNHYLIALNNPITEKWLKNKLAKQTITKRSLAYIAELLSVLRAPYAGTIRSQIAQQGHRYAQNENILTLAQLNRVYVNIYMPSEQVSLWQQGEVLLVAKQGGLIHDLPLYSSQKAGQFDPKTGMSVLSFWAHNTETNLQPQQWLTVLNLQPEQTVYWLPESAVVARDGKSWCIVKITDKHYQAIKIKVGGKYKGKVPVIAGSLKNDQKVVIENAYELLYADINSLIKFVD
ncbi:MAG: efflux RND transporter periplasmic adaptor subunit [Aliivibrio sp.]|uniref:efflux RND transporter periplasmic adaptor subunit n=1 Tax=Aliivibrio sp. TaxID=1872443 RepID=UPI001A43A092|nr:efflux RND transporter periplasmic adaptor subunit [Aliivibrio sp.]